MPLLAPVISRTRSSAMSPILAVAIIRSPVDPQRKRKIRLVVALSVAVLLAVALVYTSFSAASEAKEPSQLVGLSTSSSIDMTGKVVPGSIRHRGEQLRFRVVDREGGGPTLPVTYSGTVP